MSAVHGSLRHLEAHSFDSQLAYLEVLTREARKRQGVSPGAKAELVQMLLSIAQSVRIARDSPIP